MSNWFDRGWSYSQNGGLALAQFYRLAVQEGLLFGGRGTWRSEVVPTPDTIGGVGGESIATWASPYESDALIRMPDGLALLTWSSQEISAHVVAPSAAQADGIRGAIYGAFPPSVVSDEQVDANFWYMTAHGPQKTTRKIDVPSWAAIRDNYAQTVREELERTMFGWTPGAGGRMLLWTGPVGCGKTYALRALAREWRPWCQIDYITDPEEFFGKPAYMMSALLQQGGSDVPSTAASVGDAIRPSWHLVVLEDCGEMLTKDAKERVGPNLGRLLNLTDGLIGQGLRVLVLVTTNEDSGSLHDAVVRPGRCASRVAFNRLNDAEVRIWRAGHSLEQRPTPRSVSLAELFAEKGGIAMPRQISTPAGFGRLS